MIQSEVKKQKNTFVYKRCFFFGSHCYQSNLGFHSLNFQNLYNGIKSFLPEATLLKWLKSEGKKCSHYSQKRQDISKHDDHYN